MAFLSCLQEKTNTNVNSEITIFFIWGFFEFIKDNTKKAKDQTKLLAVKYSAI